MLIEPPVTPLLFAGFCVNCVVSPQVGALKASVESPTGLEGVSQRNHRFVGRRWCSHGSNREPGKLRGGERRRCYQFDCCGPCCQPMSAICGRQRSSKAAALFGQNGVLYVRFSYQTATDSAGRQLFLLYDPKRHGERDPALTAGDTLNITVTNNPQSTDTPAPRTLVVC
jgi:hypothetical protein